MFVVSGSVAGKPTTAVAELVSVPVVPVGDDAVDRIDDRGAGRQHSPFLAIVPLPLVGQLAPPAAAQVQVRR